MVDDEHEEIMNINEDDWWNDDEDYEEVVVDLIHSFDNLFNEVASIYEVPIDLKSFKMAYETNDQALVKSKKGNCEEFKIAKAFALKARRDCYVDIENYKMAGAIDKKYKSYCATHNLDI